jgi:hypothetical protein
MQLCHLIHLPCVEALIHPLAILVELYISVRILVSSEASIAEQLLDCIIETAVEKNQALAAIQLLCELCPLHISRNIVLCSVLRQSFDRSISNISRIKCRV